jgi:hypothetical protein
VDAALPTPEELAAFSTPSDAINFMKKRLLLAGVSTSLWKDAAKPPSYRDITSATEKHTSALTASIAKTANSLLIATQELRLRRARNEVWTGATYLEKRVTDTDDATQTEVTQIDLLKTFHEVSVTTMIGLATTFWADPAATHKADDGVSQHYIRKCFGDLLFKSLSPDFKLLIQNKIPDSVLLDGPLIWITIAHEIFPSATMLRQTLKQDLLRLNLAQLDDNYASYLQKLRSSLLLSPDDYDDQVCMTFLCEMKNHPSPAVSQPFVTEHTNYCIQGTLSSPFLELVSVAEKLVSIVDLDSTTVPRKPAAKPLPKAIPESEDGDLLALFAKSIDDQQDSIKQILSMLASSDNQIKQFKANYSRNDSNSSGGSRYEKKSRSMPPWMDETPSDVSETKLWDNRTWHYCALCKQGRGSWSPSHSTSGDTAKGIAAHRGGKQPLKRNHGSTDDSSAPPPAKKTRFADKPPFRSMKAAFASNGKSLQELLKSRRAAAAADNEGK